MLFTSIIFSLFLILFSQDSNNNYEQNLTITFNKKIYIVAKSDYSNNYGRLGLDWDEAKTYCKNYSEVQEGIGTWQLPSLDVMKEIYKVLNKSNNKYSFFIDSKKYTTYWTSSIEGNLAIDFNISTGKSTKYSKDEPRYVRCVKKVNN